MNKNSDVFPIFISKNGKIKEIKINVKNQILNIRLKKLKYL